MSASYLIKRFLAAIPVLFIVSLIAFLFIHMIPGDPALAMLGRDTDPEQLQSLRRAMGLDRPLPLQYLHWLGRAVQGDLGTSIISGRPVMQAISERFPHTIILALTAMLLSILIAIPSGILAAVKQNTLVDKFFMFFAFLGVSVPSFWVGIMAMLLFAVKLHWLPASGYVSIFENFFQGLRYIILPAFSLSLVMAAVSARMTRASMLETMRQDYMRTARAKGLSRRKTIIGHGLKNALIPVVTVIGVDFGWLLGGTVVIETVFGIPGIGRLIVYAITNRDYPVIQGIILYTAVIYMLVNLVVDIIVAFLNPRIRY
jgi:peptide/nickel transport system permease protein